MINDRAWWENEFLNNWEVGFDGKEQTLYFAQLMLANLPEDVKAFLSVPGTTVLDWGCALGQAVNLVQATFPDANVTGLDFAEKAIEKARVLFPGNRFISRTFNKEIDFYDVVYTSNCLEHFSNPMDNIKDLLEGTGKYFIALVPYNQGGFAGPMDMGCHFYSFTESSFPGQIGDFARQHCKVIPPVNPDMWNDNQLLVIYERRR